MSDIPVAIAELLQNAYVSDPDSMSLVRQLAGVVEKYFEKIDEDEKEAHCNTDRLVEQLEDAAQRGWDQAIEGVEGILKERIRGASVEELDHLDELLEEVEGLWASVPDPFVAFLATPRPAWQRIQSSAPEPAIEVVQKGEAGDPAPITRGGGKHQVNAMAFIRASGCQSTKAAVRAHLIDGGVSVTGAYGAVQRLINSGRVIALTDDLVEIVSL